MRFLTTVFVTDKEAFDRPDDKKEIPTNLGLIGELNSLGMDYAIIGQDSTHILVDSIYPMTKATEFLALFDKYHKTIEIIRMIDDHGFDLLPYTAAKKAKYLSLLPDIITIDDKGKEVKTKRTVPAEVHSFMGWPAREFA